MTTTVFCRKYQKDLPALTSPPYPGPKGKEIFDTVSRQAWQEWQKQQTMLINEKQLSMMNADHRRYLQEEMDKFFANEQHDVAEGYVPPEKD
jgi:Fe-S cluster biosynthesis and repair protein YggX